MNKTTKPTSKPHCIRAGGSAVRLQDRRHRGEAWETFGEVAGSAHKPGSMLPMANTRTAPWMKGTQYPTAVTAISCHLWGMLGWLGRAMEGQKKTS